MYKLVTKVVWWRLDRSYWILKNRCYVPFSCATNAKICRLMLVSFCSGIRIPRSAEGHWCCYISWFCLVSSWLQMPGASSKWALALLSRFTGQGLCALSSFTVIAGCIDSCFSISSLLYIFTFSPCTRYPDSTVKTASTVKASCL